MSPDIDIVPSHTTPTVTFTGLSGNGDITSLRLTLAGTVLIIRSNASVQVFLKYSVDCDRLLNERKGFEWSTRCRISGDGGRINERLHGGVVVRCVEAQVGADCHVVCGDERATSLACPGKVLIDSVALFMSREFSRK